MEIAAIRFAGASTPGDDEPKKPKEPKKPEEPKKPGPFWPPPIIAPGFNVIPGERPDPTDANLG